ncbi:MAG TPA: TonB-dependent receptor [Blastocatellia bacterium]|nr:TonB-dependent receptor [Blastocatellia bacterium]
MRISNRCISLALTLFLVAGLAVGQNPLGRLAGSVRDPKGAVVSGAKITLTRETTGQQQTTSTNGEGGFGFPQLSPGFYTVKIEMTGFKTASYVEVKVDPGQEYSLTITLEVGGADETVQVSAGADLVNTTSAELNNTVAQRQILDLPLNGRNPIELIRLQAGVVGIPTRTNTAINGGRPTWTEITQDGINIQDNFIRTNSLDFVPNRPTSDSIGEFTITTNTQGADAAGGASQVKLVTPSGTNEFHGSLFEFNRNSALSANSWFNNTSAVARPFLNRNQFGGRIGGPVRAGRLKDKLFFFGYYEGFRQVVQAVQNNTIPANNDFLTGVFRYVQPNTTTVQTVNVLSLLPGVTLDQKVKALILDRAPAASNVNNFDVGNSTADRILNTAGFRFRQSRLTTRNYFGFRTDYQLTDAHRFEFIFTRLTDVDDRPDLDAISIPRPKIFTDATTKLIVGAWRWSATPHLSNELRIGANLAPVSFDSSVDYSGIIFGVPFITNREVTFQPQGRDTRTRQFIDNASYVTGEHSFQFGGSLQQVRVNPFNFAGRFPSVGFGFSVAAPASIQLTAANFPGGISATDLANANSLRSFLGGVINTVSQSFQVKDKTSGFVAGIPEDRNFSLNDYAFYVQDNWRLRPNLTLRLGVKWEYFGPLIEDNDLSLLPVLGGRSPQEALLDPNGTVDFVKGQFYKKDLNNFAPSLGIAWDPFKNGKTSIRAGYTVAYVNEETIRVAQGASANNAGLASSNNLVNLFTTVNGGVPVVPAPAFKVPRTYADQLALAPLAAAYTIDPNLKQPYVHQISLSVQREIGLDTAVEARYVGTLGRKVWQAVDLNQIKISSAYLEDFLRARSNGFLALARPGGTFNPAFNAAIPGSQQLTVIPTIGGGALTNATVRSLIQTGQPGSLAETYINSRFAGANALFLPNPGIGVADLVGNGAETDYHAFQGEVRRRLKNGITGQMNYTFSKVLTNSSGTGQTRFEPFLDNARPELERSRAEFDITHNINANLIVELPFGKGKRFLTSNNVLDRVVGGWQVSSIIHWQSGAPISILSGRGTFNRGGRSGNNGANTGLSAAEIKALFGIRKLPDGRVFYIDPKVIDPATGRAVGDDNLNNSAGFASQVFFNPITGTLGALQRLQFDGPAQVAWDFSLVKRTRITERVNSELRAEFFNVLNHPGFFVGDQGINSTQFGRITGLNQAARIVQLALKVDF